MMKKVSDQRSGQLALQRLAPNPVSSEELIGMLHSFNEQWLMGATPCDSEGNGHLVDLLSAFYWFVYCCHCWQGHGSAAIADFGGIIGNGVSLSLGLHCSSSSR